MENKFEQNIIHIFASLTYKLQLDKIYVETFIKTLEVLVKILEIQQDLIPEIICDDYQKVILGFYGKKEKSVNFHIWDDSYFITKYDHKEGYKQNLELNEELFEWLWST